jgi:hypothetical protein
MPKTQRVPGRRLLIAEPPLQVLPSLAAAIGLHEAIVLQQLHYWLLASPHERDGRVWVYNTLEGWHAQFPFLSLMTLRRALGELEHRRHLVLTARYNRLPTDRTKWYTIDYDALAALPLPSTQAVAPAPSVQGEQMGTVQNEQMPSVQNEQLTTVQTEQMTCVQNEQMNCSDCADGVFKMNRCNQETTTETTSRDYPGEDQIESRARGRPSDEAVIRRVFTDYCREFGDDAPAGATGTRAVNLWRRSRLPRDAFLALAREARRRTRLYQGKQPPGMAIAAKAPYFFAILESALYDGTRNSGQ